MKAVQVVGIAGAIAFVVMIRQFGGDTPPVAAPTATPAAVIQARTPPANAFAAVAPEVAARFTTVLAQGSASATATAAEPPIARAEITDDSTMKLAAISPQEVVAPMGSASDAAPKSDGPSTSAPAAQDFQYLIYYVWSELPPAEKPADVVLRSFKDIPVGTPVEEIKRASDAFGLDSNFMKAVAKIESGFDPKQRTGSYIGLFQLSEYEFGKFGSGQIRSARDNAVAAAYKVITEGILFEWVTHRKPTLSDLYLIHQQGWEGAAEHISRPDRIAWKSMCATGEGREKGEKWCKRAIWRNTLPDVKRAWKSVDKLTSEAFVGMWRARVAEFQAKYMAAATAEAGKQQAAIEGVAAPSGSTLSASGVNQR